MVRKALVVGISTYKYLPNLNLETFSNNAEAIAQKLQHNCNFEVTRLPAIKGSESEPIVVGKKTPVTKAELEQAIVELFQPQGNFPPTTALLYFAGHGEQKTKGFSGGYLVTSDADFKQNWGLSLSELRRLLKGSNINEQIIWLDSCYSGDLFDLKEADPGERNNGSRCFIAAAINLAYADNKGDYGVFTQALLEGLNPSKYPSGDINNLSLTDFVIREIRRSKFPQTPVSHNSGQPIVLKQSSPTEKKPTIDYQITIQILDRLLPLWNDAIIVWQEELLISKEYRLKWSLFVSIVFFISAIFTCIQWNKAEIREAEALEASADALLLSDQKFDALIKNIKGAKKINGFLYKYCDFIDICDQRTKLKKQIRNNLLQLVYDVEQINRLEGHEDWVYAVDFCQSENELKNSIATASADGTFKIWKTKQITPEEKSFYKEINLGIPSVKKHSQWVYDIAFNRDCMKIATAGKDKTVKIWKWEGNVLESNDISIFHDDRVSSVSFSPDGTLLASASWDKTVKIWNLKIGNSQTLLEDANNDDLTHADQVFDVSFSPDGTQIASASTDETIKLWKAQANGKFTLEQILETNNQENNEPDENSNCKNIQSDIKNPSDKISSVSFSSDGKLLASASWDMLVKLWKLKKDNKFDTKCPTILKGHTDRVSAVSFSLDGTKIATASWDKTVKIWNKEGSLLKTLKGHKDIVFDVSFSEDSKIIASASADNNVILWQENQEWLPMLQGHTKDVRRVDFSPDGNTIATASQDGTVRLWNAENGTLKSILKHKKDDQVYGLDFISDTLIATSGTGEQIKLWKFNQASKPLWENKPSDNPNLIFDISFSPDRNWMVSAESNYTARLWKIKKIQENNSEKIFAEYFCTIPNPDDHKNRHSDRVVDVEIILPGEGILKVLTASDDGTAKIWGIKVKDKNCRFEETLPQDNQKGHKSEVNGVSFVSHGSCQIVATASDDKTIKLWDLGGKEILINKERKEEERNELKEIEGHSERVLSVKLSSKLNGKKIENTVYLASASFDKTVKLWEIKCNLKDKQAVKMNLLRTFRGHDDWVWDVSFSPDGKKLASASRDKTVRLWSLKDIETQSRDFNELVNRGCSVVQSYLKTVKRERDICPNSID